jgi:type II secretory pathway predicted ATPase ExeA
VYLDHWSLERSPFEAQPDSRFLFATEQHEQALAAVSYAACEGGEPVLLRGPAGCGKTLLLRAVRRQLPRERYQVAFVPEVACARVGLLRRAAYHLAHSLVADAAAAMDTILRQAQDAEASGRSLVLMFDDWPVDAEPGTLDELRWLLNLDLEGCRVCVLLAGEEVRPRKHWPAWLMQRLFTTVQLGPLESEQVADYLAHRLAVAAGKPDDRSAHGDTFSPEAAAVIADWSAGVPRLINRLAHLALHVTYLELAQQVGPDGVRRAIERLTPAATAAGDAPVPAAAVGANR